MIKELSNIEIIRLIGIRLRQYRLNLNVTQREMSNLSGVSLPTIQKMESGSAGNINLSNLLKIMRFLGILENVNQLVPEQPQSPYASRQRNRIRHGNETNEY
ncbi:MAG: helix-turn-helix transcriptional regulator [Bacteroidales bacterium]|nr:helix-turn-helix transcriptional regulator [Bacteroidales bacterium]MBR1637013.1 helix-turn-helix transcriptional regulator [Bacteroidales bacterium]MBR1893644.1 helix-turn-helix transcriptional regulator [Bacteroidales bacterium]